MNRWLSPVAVALLIACNGGGDTDTNVDPGDVETIYSYDEDCGTTTDIGPSTGEEGHQAAVAVDTGEFNANGVIVTMSSNTEFAACDSSGTHTISVWVGSSDFPDTSPSDVQTYDATGDESDSPELRVVFDEPIEIGSGENLFVSVDFNGTFPDVSCTLACSDGDGSLSFWSGADEAPYSWSSLAGLGIDADLFVEVFGTRP